MHDNKHITDTPTLRFPDFEGAWVRRKLGEYTKSSAFGPRFSSDLYSNSGNVLTLRTTDMDDDGKIDFETAPKAKVDLEKFRDHLLFKNDLIISRSGTIGITGIFEGYKMPVIPGAFLIRFRLNSESLESKFVQIIFNSEKGRNQVENLSAGGVQKNLTGSSLANLELSLPTLPEQQKIAQFFTAIDDKIQQLKQKKAQLEQYKKGVMQQIFSQALRFTDDDGRDFGEWEVRRLGEVCEINPKSSKIPEKFHYIDLESVESGIFLKKVEIYRNEAPSRAQRLLEKGDVLFQMVRPYQKNNYHFNNNDGFYVASTGYAQLRALENKAYIFQYLHLQSFVDKVIEKCTGTSFPAINSSDLSNIEIPLPSLPEQQKIAQFLTVLDEKIAQAGAQIEQAEVWKKGLLQKMFV
jgi:type I restriction enzyme, S subunit